MPQPNENLVLDALRQIKDPDLHKDIVTLGFIKDLSIDNGNVSFRIVLTTPACPVKAEMESAAHELVSAIPGTSSVKVTMDADVYGPNVPIMLGASQARPEIEGNKLIPIEA